jgi:hypothetical protein
VGDTADILETGGAGLRLYYPLSPDYLVVSFYDAIGISDKKLAQDVYKRVENSRRESEDYIGIAVFDYACIS